MSIIKEPQGKSLSAFLTQVSDLVKNNIREEWITAEISASSANKPGAHLYLDLIENDATGKEIAKTKANLWASTKDKLVDKFNKETGATLRAGIKVMLLVSASFHPQYGFSIVIKDINPTFTIGDMQKKLLQIKKALTEAGVINLNRSKKMPTEFTRVAVIAPADAAGLGDFKSQADILEQAQLCHFDYFHARFQGVGAADEIVGALNKATFKNFELGSDRYYDAVVIIRGGGAASDLAYLNEFGLADAVCRSAIPVFIGVGHERDQILLDELATYSAHTPSKLIGFITDTIMNNAQATAKNWQYIVAFTGRVAAVTTELLAANMAAIKSNGKAACEKVLAKTKTDMALISAEATGTLKSVEQKMTASLETIKQGSSHALLMTKSNIDNAFNSVIGLGPKKTQERGFVIVRKDGKAISRKTQTKEHDILHLEFSDGNIPVKML